MKTIALPSMLGIFLALSLHTTPALATPETWVASNGGGAACTRAAPCSTFTAAHAATDPGGIIKCVDAGNFGSVIITKSITIDCTDTNGGILVGGIAVVINAPGVVVTLRGLSIHAAGTGINGGINGVQFASGSALHIENCRISGFQTGLTPAGIFFAPSAGTAKLHVSDTVISNNGTFDSGIGGGIFIRPVGSVRAVLTRVQVENNTSGIFADGVNSTGSIIVQVRDSVVAGNSVHGIAAVSSAGFTAIVADRSSSLLNGGDGIRAQGASAVVHIGSSTVIGNSGGLIALSGGQILSYQNNQASGNGVDGAPTGVLTVK